MKEYIEVKLCDKFIYTHLVNQINIFLSKSTNERIRRDENKRLYTNKKYFTNLLENRYKDSC